MATNETTVILLRHGRSTYNERGIYQGCSDDSVLTAQGQRDAYNTGLFLQELLSEQNPLDAVYTSPLQRTQQTAREIIAALNTATRDLPPLHLTETLKEIYMSEWQGLSYRYVREHFAQSYRLWKEQPHQFYLPNQESATPALCFPVLDLYDQAQRFWQEILPRHRGQTILIVGHSGTNRALMSTAIALPPKRYHLLQQSNCGISIVEFSQPSYTCGQLKALNVTTHLGESLPKLKEGKYGLRLLWMAAETIEQWTPLLNRVNIDFALSSDRHANQLRQLGPLAEPLYQSDDYWQTLLEQYDPQRLTTGVVLGRSTSYPLESVLAPEPGTLAVIHYPRLHTPVLQALMPIRSLKLT